MKKLLLYTLIIISPFSALGQIQGGLISDFQNATKQGWEEWDFDATASLVPNGGPTGNGDAYLEIITPNGFAVQAGTLNESTPWRGDYYTEGIQFIEFDMKNTGTTDLNFRVSLGKEDPIQGGVTAEYSVTSSQIAALPSSQTTWQHYVIAIDLANVVSAPGATVTKQAILQDVAGVTILNQMIGPGNFAIDNITVGKYPLSNSTVVSKETSITIFPTVTSAEINVESTDKLNKLEVLGLNGSVLLTTQIDNSKTHNQNISTLSSGMYFIRLTTSENQVLYKRVIKR